MLKNLLQRLLSLGGVFLYMERKSRVAGLRLEHDLSVLIGREDPTCMDVGANQGQTIELLQRTFSNPIIHSFEPSTQTFAELSARKYRPGVTLHQFAFGEEPGEAVFHNYEASVLSSFLPLNQDANESVFATERLHSTETVAIHTIDDFLSDSGMETLDLLKVDTQGFDLRVLRGARKALERGCVRNVVVELNFSKLYEGQNDPLELISFLRAYNFELVDFYEKQRRSGGELSWVTGLFKRRA